MSSKGKSSGYLYRCSEGAESFSVRLAKPGRAEVREKSGVTGLRNALTYKETRCASRNYLCFSILGKEAEPFWARMQIWLGEILRKPVSFDVSGCACLT